VIALWFLKRAKSSTTFKPAPKLWKNLKSIFQSLVRTPNFIYSLNTLRYWISINWVSISKFQITTQIRVGHIYSNQIEFWVLIYYKFKILGLRVLITTCILLRIKIEDDHLPVRLILTSIIEGIISIPLLVPPQIQIWYYYDYIIIWIKWTIKWYDFDTIHFKTIPRYTLILKISSV